MLSRHWTTRRFVLIGIILGCSVSLLFIASQLSLLSLSSYQGLNIDHVLDTQRQSSHPDIDPPAQASVAHVLPHDGADLSPTTTAITDPIPLWHFDSARDARSHALTDAQCDSAFPGLWVEINRAANFWKSRGGVKEEDNNISWQLRIGMARLMIHEQQLFIVGKNWTFPKYDVPRALALLHSINRAVIASPTPVPNIEFSITLGDWPDDPDNSHPAWVLSRSSKETSKWVMPDFGYWSWPLGVLGEYSEIRRQINDTEPAWEHKQAKAVWRGSTSTNPLREVLVAKSKGKAWSDIKAVVWAGDEPMVADGSGLPLSIPEHCAYKYVVHTEGHSYSGRTKYLLNCHSVSIIHAQEWIEPHSHLYQVSGPDQNAVQVRRDWSDLDKTMRRLLKDDANAQRIAARSVDIFRDRYLTPAAMTCYWRKLMRTWAQTMVFEPRLFDVAEDGKKRARGVPYESFVADLVDPATTRIES